MTTAQLQSATAGTLLFLLCTFVLCVIVVVCVVSTLKSDHLFVCISTLLIVVSLVLFVFSGSRLHSCDHHLVRDPRAASCASSGTRIGSRGDRTGTHGAHHCEARLEQRLHYRYVSCTHIYLYVNMFLPILPLRSKPCYTVFFCPSKPDRTVKSTTTSASTSPADTISSVAATAAVSDALATLLLQQQADGNKEKQKKQLRDQKVWALLAW